MVKVFSRTQATVDFSETPSPQGSVTGCPGDSGGPVVLNGKVISVYSSQTGRTTTTQNCGEIGRVTEMLVAPRLQEIQGIIERIAPSCKPSNQSGPPSNPNSPPGPQSPH